MHLPSRQKSRLCRRKRSYGLEKIAPNPDAPAQPAKVTPFAGGKRSYGLEKIAPNPDAPAQPAKVTPFAGGNEATVSKKSPPIPIHLLSRQKSRLLPAETKLRSRKNRPQSRSTCPAGKSHAFCRRKRSYGLEKIAPDPDAPAQPAKVTPFAGGNEATVSKKSPKAIFSN